MARALNVGFLDQLEHHQSTVSNQHIATNMFAIADSSTTTHSRFQNLLQTQNPNQNHTQNPETRSELTDFKSEEAQIAVDVVSQSHPDIPQMRVSTPIIEAAEANRTERGKLALLMHSKWLIRLLYYGKTWEIRGRDTKVRDKIYLARKKQIFGETRVVDSFSVSTADLSISVARSAHHIADLSIVAYKTPFAWKFAETRIYSRPITFTRKKGQIIWCRVDMDRLNAQTDSIVDVDAGELPSLVPRCCNKTVCGTAVMCDQCDGAWHIYCLLHFYNVKADEVERIQKDGEAFVCYDCIREKMGKVKSRGKPSRD